MNTFISSYIYIYMNMFVYIYMNTGAAAGSAALKSLEMFSIDCQIVDSNSHLFQRNSEYYE